MPRNKSSHQFEYKDESSASNPGPDTLFDSLDSTSSAKEGNIDYTDNTSKAFSRKSLKRSKSSLIDDEDGKKDKNEKNESKQKDCGLDDIDALFAVKKENDVALKKEEKAEDERRKKLKHDRSTEKNMYAKSAKKICLSYDRDDVSKLKSGEWAKDGLGGVFNTDGYTGRKEEGSGFKIYKAHLFNKKGFGTTKDCPFDCQCCYI